jgi:hypothetical protein
LLAIEEGANGAKAEREHIAMAAFILALARRFNIRVMLRVGKAKTSMKTPLVSLLRLELPRALTLPSRNTADLLLLRGKHGHFPRIQRERNSLLVRLSGY